MAEDAAFSTLANKQTMQDETQKNNGDTGGSLLIGLAPNEVNKKRQLANRARPAYWSALLIASFVVLIFQQPNVILAHSNSEFRCSHVPPTPEQVNHVWLDNGQFTPSEPSSVPDDSGQQQTQAMSMISSPSPDSHPGAPSARQRRHIGSKSDELANSDNQQSAHQPRGDAPSSSSFQETLWNLLKKTEREPTAAKQQQQQQRPTQSRTANLHFRDDLVPMKIQVHYDSSVYELDKKRLQSINETVIPSVVKFFEDVLLIRREYTIDRFRISRRCPNNTIYYAKDVAGLSRPYCMERCLDHAVCGEMIVPREHLAACSYCNTTSRRCTTNYTSEGKGVENTQLLLYVSAKQTARCRKDQTIAYAAHCAQDTKTDRPVAGHANLCPSSIGNDPKDLKALIATVKHELTHVLGFSVSLFAYYRDDQGSPLTQRDSTPGPIPVDPRTGYAKWSDRVIKRVVRSNWATGSGPVDKETHMIVTPAVVREVRRHFNCSSLEGAELEDQGSDGTSMTHWEKRLFENEAMTGTHTQNSVYSRITLAVLQDTGWYVANFSRAERLEWGKDLGCDFAKKSCKSWIDDRRAKQLSIRPFCDRVKGDLLQIACTEDRSSKAVCNMRHYKEPLPGVYQNFDSLEDTDSQDLAHFGGSVDLADYCPFIQEFTWQVQNVTVRGSRCDLGGNSVETEKNAALEHYGPDSRCFEHGRRWEQRSCVYKRHWHHFGAGCYKYSCSGGHANVHVGNSSYACYYADQLVHVEQLVDNWLYNGTLVCPACDKVCPPSKCFNYDKRLIDQIFEMSNLTDLGENNVNTNNNNNSDIMLSVILDEYFNGIDTTGVVDFKKTFARYKSVLDEVNELASTRKIRPDSPSLLAFPFKTQPSREHHLVCASTSINHDLMIAAHIVAAMSLHLFLRPFLQN